jgi:outer membrane biosynthesis protein TonB
MEASVYSEAKGEYTKQLTLFIVPTYHRFFMECLQQAATEEPQAKRQLWKFQELLSQIPDWNMDRVQRETSRLIQEIQCDYLEELLTAVFIAHTKVLTAIRVGNKNKRVQITIPKLDHFIHRALSECSRLLWSSAYLFHSELSPIEKQKNHRQIEQLLHEGIAQAIRGLLPVKNILKDYLAEPDADQTEDDDADDEEEETKKEPEPEAAPAPEPVVEAPIPEPVMEAPIPEPVVEAPIPEPVVEAPIPEPVVEAPAPAPAPAPEPVVEAAPPAPIVEPVEQPSTPAPTPVTPTIIVQTEPTVKFTDFDQVIQQRGGRTHIDYVEQDRDMSDDEEIHFIGDEGEPLSDFEDLTEGPPASLDDVDFETLG